MNNLSEETPADLGIVGGGLAGLSLAILQAKAGKNVHLFERYDYPFHRVCGEYISLESRRFLGELGVSVEALKLPIITNFILTTPAGHELKTRLPLGGFGISRYRLDALLAENARAAGVTLHNNTKVTDVQFQENHYLIITDKSTFAAKRVAGAFGKRSNLDVQWKRPFIAQNRRGLNQYIGVKYHIRYDFPKDTIALHNFRGGYCGISAIEDNLYCLCYLTTKANLTAAGGSIPQMEAGILSKNPYLKDIFQNAHFEWDKPEVISQVSFEPKERSYNQLLLLGDAAGLVAPLTGNGMSMAMHSALLYHRFYDNPAAYVRECQAEFDGRLRAGRWLQRFFGHHFQSELLLRTVGRMPWLLDYIIRQTHGEKEFSVNDGSVEK